MTADQGQALQLATEAGHILLGNGAEISRVEETMERIAAAYGVDDESFFVLSNGIIATGQHYARAIILTAALFNRLHRKNRPPSHRKI